MYRGARVGARHGRRKSRALRRSALCASCFRRSRVSPAPSPRTAHLVSRVHWNSPDITLARPSISHTHKLSAPACETGLVAAEDPGDVTRRSVRLLLQLLRLLLLGVARHSVNGDRTLQVGPSWDVDRNRHGWIREGRHAARNGGYPNVGRGREGRGGGDYRRWRVRSGGEWPVGVSFIGG